MNYQYAEHFLRIDMSATMTDLPSLRHDFTSQGCNTAPRLGSMRWPAPIISIEEAARQHPAFFSQLKPYISAPCNEPYAFNFEMTQLGNRPTRKRDRGMVFVLPIEFMGQIAVICNTMPSIVEINSVIDELPSLYLCWASDQFLSPETHDLWFPVQWSGAAVYPPEDDYVDFSPEATQGEYFWTDLLIVCGDKIAAGGFWFSYTEFDSVMDENDIFQCFTPFRHESEKAPPFLDRWTQKANTEYPWHEKACTNAAGRRYRCIATYEGELPTQ